jgi:transposase
MRYSRGFKNGILRKVLPPENRSVYSVAKEAGISPVTIRSWLTKVNEGILPSNESNLEPISSQIGMKEKLKLLIESKTLPEEKLGEWLRQHGLHSEHLNHWEQEVEAIMIDKQQDVKRENVELKKENKNLKRELARSQAAMAEALALITLKKKAQNLFYSTEED